METENARRAGARLAAALACAAGVLVVLLARGRGERAAAISVAGRAAEGSAAPSEAGRAALELHDETPQALADVTPVERRPVLVPESGDDGGAVRWGPADRILLRVVRASDRAPVPGAVVAWRGAPEEDSAGDLACFARGAFAAGAGSESTRSLRADRHGRVRIPGPGVVACADAGRSALRAVDRYDSDDDEPLELVLYRDRALTVRVVDASGAPAPGAGIAVFAVDEDGDLDELLLRATTRADGACELTQLRALAWNRDPRPRRLLVAPFGVYAPRTAVLVDVAALPKTVVLRRPPSTGVDVVLTCPDGTPWTGPALVSLFHEPPDDVTPGTPDYAEVYTEDGVARFDQIGADLPLSVYAYGPGFVERPYDPERKSTARAGERLTLELPVEADLPYRVTLVWPDGAPCAERDVQRLASRFEKRGAVARLATSRAGELAFERDEATSPSEDPFDLHFVVAESSHLWTASVTMPSEHRPRDRQLGVLTLAEVAPIVRGRVVAGAAPIAGARIDILAHRGGCMRYGIWTDTTDALGRFAVWFPRSAGWSFAVSADAPRGFRDAERWLDTLPAHVELKLEAKASTGE